MGDRKPVTVKVDEDVWAKFKQFVDEKHDGVYGELGRATERALEEYMDHDRYARVEEKLDTILETVNDEKRRTKKGGPAQKAQERRENIISRLVDEKTVQVHRSDITSEIKAEGLSSDKTIKKYLKRITSDGPFMPHPNSPSLWEVDKEQAKEQGYIGGAE